MPLEEVETEYSRVEQFIMRSIGAQSPDDALFTAMRIYMGCMASGHTHEEAWFMFHGAAGAGKTTIASMLRVYLGYLQQSKAPPALMEIGKPESFYPPHAAKCVGYRLIEFPDLRSVTRSDGTLQERDMNWLKTAVDTGAMIEFRSGKTVKVAPRTWSSVLFHFNGDIRMKIADDKRNDSLRRMFMVKFHEVPEFEREGGFKRELFEQKDNPLRRGVVRFIADCVRSYQELVVDTGSKLSDFVPPEWQDLGPEMLQRAENYRQPKPKVQDDDDDKEQLIERIKNVFHMNFEITKCRKDRILNMHHVLPQLYKDFYAGTDFEKDNIHSKVLKKAADEIFGFDPVARYSGKQFYQYVRYVGEEKDAEMRQHTQRQQSSPDKSVSGSVAGAAPGSTSPPSKQFFPTIPVAGRSAEPAASAAPTPKHTSFSAPPAISTASGPVDLQALIAAALAGERQKDREEREKEKEAMKNQMAKMQADLEALQKENAQLRSQVTPQKSETAPVLHGNQEAAQLSREEADSNANGKRAREADDVLESVEKPVKIFRPATITARAPLLAESSSTGPEKLPKASMNPESVGMATMDPEAFPLNLTLTQDATKDDSMQQTLPTDTPQDLAQVQAILKQAAEGDIPTYRPASLRDEQQKGSDTF